jgi:hypothetical protein
LKVGGTMKHKEEWYTCDRCGNEINRLPEHRDWFGRMKMNKEEFKMIHEESQGYLSDKYELIKDNVLSVEIIGYSRRKEKTFHLCPKCRKDFEVFMNNE